MTHPRVTLIVARARNGVIGRNGTIPWCLPEDMAHFKATTMGHPVIMGRRTFDSLGKPLPGRRNIVVTRNRDWSHKRCERAGSLAEAVALAGGSVTSDVFVIGGAQLYAEAVKIADRAIVTEIDIEPAGDAFFDWPLAGWVRRTSGSAMSQHDLVYRIDEWVRAL